MKDKQSEFNPIRTESDPVYNRSIVMISSKNKYFKSNFPYSSYTSVFSLIYNYKKLLNPSEYYPPFIEITEARKTLEFSIGQPIVVEESIDLAISCFE